MSQCKKFTCNLTFGQFGEDVENLVYVGCSLAVPSFGVLFRGKIIKVSLGVKLYYFSVCVHCTYPPHIKRTETKPKKQSAFPCRFFWLECSQSETKYLRSFVARFFFCKKNHRNKKWKENLRKGNNFWYQMLRENVLALCIANRTLLKYSEKLLFRTFIHESIREKTVKERYSEKIEQWQDGNSSFVLRCRYITVSREHIIFLRCNSQYVWYFLPESINNSFLLRTPPQGTFVVPSLSLR